MKTINCQSSLDAFQELAQTEDQKLEAVLQRVEDGCLDLIVLKFSDGVLTFTAEADTDVVEVHCQEHETFDSAGLVHVSNVSPWSSMIGRSFGWGWVAINQQGYQDGVLLSFGGLEPSVLFVVAASSLRVYLVNEVVNGTVGASNEG